MYIAHAAIMTAIMCQEIASTCTCGTDRRSLLIQISERFGAIDVCQATDRCEHPAPRLCDQPSNQSAKTLS